MTILSVDLMPFLLADHEDWKGEFKFGILAIQNWNPFFNKRKLNLYK
jgi:hypothetical protein